MTSLDTVDSTNDGAVVSDSADLVPLVEESLKARKRATIRGNVLIRVGQLSVVVVLLGSWELANRLGWLDNADIFFSKPTDIVKFMVDNAQELATQAWATIEAALIGLALGAILGGLSGLILGRLDTLDRIVDPIITVLTGVPRIALAPLFLLWFGITMQAKIFLAFSLVYFIVLLNARSAVRTVDMELQYVARLLGAPRWKVMLMVVIPAANPVLLGTLRLAMVFSVLGVIASEMIASTDGLGILIVGYGQNLNPAGVFAVLAILAALMAVLNGVIRFAEKHLLSWRED